MGHAADELVLQAFDRAQRVRLARPRAQVRDLAHLSGESSRSAAHDGEERGVEQQEPGGDTAPDRAAGRVQPLRERAQVAVGFVGPDDGTAPAGGTEGDIGLEQRAARDGVARVLRLCQVRDVHGLVAGEGGAQVVVEGEGAADLRGVVRVDDAAGRVPDFDARQV